MYDSVSIFSPEILDIKPKDLRVKFQAGITNLAAISLHIVDATISSTPRSVANGFKNLLAITAATEVDFMEAATIKKFIKDSSKFSNGAAARKKPKRRNRFPRKTAIWSSFSSIKFESTKSTLETLYTIK
ncbi:60S acidic ribosomal protein P0-like [Bactrocera tryoni]|uniref:60S acidic ribosomal protein P0-like n=1 Tax=Bactrocera tryoni TaxID=59916 RepID=UPI001A9A1F24|nr:60S acidic ribosomal protein P0-like [Bactrocera tryoni]